MTTLTSGSTANFSLSGRQVLTLTADNNTTGTIKRTQYVESSSSKTDTLGPPATNRTYGPFGHETDIELTCTYGSFEYDVTGTSLVTAETDPDTGGIRGIIAPDGSVINTQRPRGSLGRLLCNWNDTWSSSSGTVSKVDYTWSDGVTKGIKVEYDGGATSQATVPVVGGNYFPLSISQINGIGFWAHSFSSGTRNCRVQLLDSTGANLALFNCAIQPGGPYFYTISSGQAASSGGNGILRYVVVQERDSAGYWDNWASGDYVVFGAVYLNPRGKARFLLDTDDGYSANLYAPAAAMSNFPKAGCSYKDILRAYNMRGNAYIPGINIGAGGYLTSEEILRLQDDYGWTIGSHSYTHPAYSNRGLGSLGPVGYADGADPYHAQASNDDSAIYADVYRGIDSLRAIGITTPDYYFALPQGKWDAYVHSAIKRLGFKTVRGAGTGSANVQNIFVGLPSGGAIPGSSLVGDGVINLPFSIQIDVSPTDKTVASTTPAADTLTITGHGWAASGAPIAFRSSGAGSYVPLPLWPGETYWVIYVDANTIKVAATYADAIAGTAIDLTAAGSGTITCHDMSDIKQYVDQAISAGATATCYTHGLSDTTAARVNFLCSYLSDKRNESLIEIPTLSELMLHRGPI